MQTIEIKPPSPKQMSKLRNGHKMRVYRPIVQGSGLQLMVNPMNFNQMTRAFNKDAGSTIYLTPEEIEVNKTVEGGALFKKIKKGLKSIGKALGSKEAIDIYKDTGKTVLKTSVPILVKAVLSSNKSQQPAPTIGEGLYLRGNGVMANGTLLNVKNSELPPALQSQNADANFFFRTQMPPYLKSVQDDSYTPAQFKKKMRGKGLYL